MPLSSLKRRQWIKLTLLFALPLALYLFLADRMSWRPRILKVANGNITSLSFAADSNTLLVGLSALTIGAYVDKDEVQVWDTSNKRLLRRLPLFAGQLRGKAEVTPDGKVVAASLLPDIDTGDDATDCALWDGRSLKWLRTPNPANPFIFMDNSHRIKICCDHYQDSEVGQPVPRSAQGQGVTLATFDMKTAKVLSRIQLGLPDDYGYVGALARLMQHPLWMLSKDGKWGAVALAKVFSTTPGHPKLMGRIMMFDARTGKTLRLWLVGNNLPSDPINTIAFSATGKNIVTRTLNAHGQAKIQLWDTQTGQLKMNLKDYPLAFSPDDKLWVSAPDNNTLHLCATQTGALVRILKDNHYPSTVISWPDLSVAFSPDGTTLATGSINGTVKLWRIK